MHAPSRRLHLCLCVNVSGLPCGVCVCLGSVRKRKRVESWKQAETDVLCVCAAGKFLRSGVSLGQPRTLFWADAAETVPLRNLVLSCWDITSEQVLGIAATHTSIVELDLSVRSCVCVYVWMCLFA